MKLSLRRVKQLVAAVEKPQRLLANVLGQFAGTTDDAEAKRLLLEMRIPQTGVHAANIAALVALRRFELDEADFDAIAATVTDSNGNTDIRRSAAETLATSQSDYAHQLILQLAREGSAQATEVLCAVEVNDRIEPLKTLAVSNSSSYRQIAAMAFALIGGAEVLTALRELKGSSNYADRTVAIAVSLIEASGDEHSDILPQVLELKE